MSQEQWTHVDDYYSGLFVQEDPALTDALRDSEAAGLDPIAVSPAQGKLLHLLVRSHQPKRVLEIGTLGGYSTLWMARGLPEGGKLVSLELEEKNAAVARKNLDRAGLNNTVEIRIGPAADTLAAMEASGEEPFDFIFIDADKESYPTYFEHALKLSRKGTVIVADNVVRSGAIIDANSTDPMVQGIRRFNERVAAEPRVTATALQTVGAKGYDGVAIILVLAD